MLNKLRVLGIVLILVSIVGFVVWFFGTSNEDTPAGYVGYVTRGAVFGKAEYVGMQSGPTSTGRRWLINAVNVSVTPYTYSEDFDGEKRVLSKDHMQISFAVHVTFRVNPDRVKDFVEHYTALTDTKQPNEIVLDAYQNFAKERIRTYARQEIERYKWNELAEHGQEISQKTQQRVLALTKDTPFEVYSVVVGNIQFPDTVAASVSEAQAATQILQRKESEVKQAEADARKRVAEAKGVAEAMEIVQQKLTNQYLQHEAIEAQKIMASSPNHTTVYIPVGAMGIPLVSNVNELADEKASVK